MSLLPWDPCLAAKHLTLCTGSQKAPKIWSRDPKASGCSASPSKHGCCWETFYIFACCGLVVEIPHITAKIQIVAPLPTSTKKGSRANCLVAEATFSRTPSTIGFVTFARRDSCDFPVFPATGKVQTRRNQGGLSISKPFTF